MIKLVSSLDQGGKTNPKVLRSVCDNGNLLSVALDESLSPIKGNNFYRKTSTLMDTFYTDKDEAELHRILLCSKMKKTMPKVKKLLSSGEDFDDRKFFESNEYHVPDEIEICEILAENKDKSVSKIVEACEEYDILSQPMLPEFPTPTGESEEDYLKQLCREGWRDMLINQGKVGSDEKKQAYLERFKTEFEVINEAQLFGYFLIVRDIINYVNDQGWLSGPGRGSAAGCLISYLIGITKICLLYTSPSPRD